MGTSFPTILLAFYFDCQKTHNSIFMAIAPNIYYLENEIRMHTAFLPAGSMGKAPTIQISAI